MSLLKYCVLLFLPLDGVKDFIKTQLMPSCLFSREKSILMEQLKVNSGTWVQIVFINKLNLQMCTCRCVAKMWEGLWLC